MLLLFYKNSVLAAEKPKSLSTRTHNYLGVNSHKLYELIEFMLFKFRGDTQNSTTER